MTSKSIANLELEDHTIHFDGIPSLGPYLKRYDRVFVLVDENTEKHCLPHLAELDFAYQPIKIPAGEAAKTINTCQDIWKSLFDGKSDRSSLLINLGGGVIGDMGGFAASCYMRGIDFIQIPTTLLSQVDASVGGKLGIDFNDLKNSIGLFRNPLAVIIDPLFLRTLPEEEMRSGYAEVIKHALIADAAQWKELMSTASFHDLDWPNIIAHSVGIKHNIVRSDPFEKGLRKLLNFGHTIGHAVESVLLPTQHAIRHGEAVALGMICESHLAMQKGLVDDADLNEIQDYILQTYGKVNLEGIDTNTLIARMQHDKKNTNNQINFTLLTDIGAGDVNHVADVELISNSLSYYKRLSCPS
ncbi:MAG: 3-dehydroquinate synthase [Saprospiraceae bacterium]|nr:3-dehydroquinate synthase [Saprospiraceae bacterium]